MKIERRRAEGPVITGFSGGGFRVDELMFAAVLISPERVEGWSPPPVSALDEGDVAALLSLEPAPEFLLLGTGPTLVRPSPAFVAALNAKGIGVEAMDSRAAARAWGVLRAEGRWIAGAFYPLG
ncbi:Mth938-like domain-containing protein [Sphingomonas sp.]|uniref:Mth938-like domain-containing protein n=1 Tax=Sphingomonas sp. TaxID=28214 RepID=UPI001B1B9526|nr:Mth938-like domain-containing protein [Sphingomonas sp.]MBO9713562.1 Mth938-like domain-containing protein [Sphingomonas sp.]